MSQSCAPGAQIRTSLSKHWPTLAQLGPKRSNFRQSLATFGQSRRGSGQIWPTLTTFDHWMDFSGRIWPTVSKLRLKLPNFGPSPANFGQFVAKLAQISASGATTRQLLRNFWTAREQAGFARASACCRVSAWRLRCHPRGRPHLAMPWHTTGSSLARSPRVVTRGLDHWRQVESG